MPVDKVIVTNTSALKAKYGDKYARVTTAINRLVKADAERDLVTRLVAIDSDTEMARVGGKAVSSPQDQAGAKAAVDAVYAHHQPHFLMILGARDVVPHIDLANPMKDEDPVVPSDVPYASDKAFSRHPEDFLGPTRVVGRLPDLTGADEPSYLVKVLGTAATYLCRDPRDYSSHFAITAAVWRRSTRKSALNLFGPDPQVFSVPPRGPAWTTRQMAPRIHFINCHGAPASPTFFGESAQGAYPPAQSARLLPAKVTRGRWWLPSAASAPSSTHRAAHTNRWASAMRTSPKARTVFLEARRSRMALPRVKGRPT